MGFLYPHKFGNWCMRQRILTEKNSLSRWCFKSTTSINYEIIKHLKSYPYMIHPFSSFRFVRKIVSNINDTLMTLVLFFCVYLFMMLVETFNKSIKLRKSSSIVTYIFIYEYRIFWETFNVIFIIMALLVTPLFITFHPNRNDTWHILRSAIDLISFCDLIIWFFTGYYDYDTKSVVLYPKIVTR